MSLHRVPRRYAHDVDQSANVIIAVFGLLIIVSFFIGFACGTWTEGAKHQTEQKGGDNV